jgi:hypothetical protein
MSLKVEQLKRLTTDLFFKQHNDFSAVSGSRAMYITRHEELMKKWV